MAHLRWSARDFSGGLGASEQQHLRSLRRGATAHGEGADGAVGSKAQGGSSKGNGYAMGRRSDGLNEKTAPITVKAHAFVVISSAPRSCLDTEFADVRPAWLRGAELGSLSAMGAGV